MKLKSIQVTDSDLSNTNIRSNFIFDGIYLVGNPNIEEFKSGGSIVFTFLTTKTIFKGDLIFEVEKEESAGGGWFPIWETIYAKAWEINPYNDLKGDKTLSSSDNSEGINIVYTFEYVK